MPARTDEERLSSRAASLASSATIKQLAGNYEAQSKLDTYAPVSRGERGAAPSEDSNTISSRNDLSRTVRETT